MRRCPACDAKPDGRGGFRCGSFMEDGTLVRSVGCAAAAIRRDPEPREEQDESWRESLDEGDETDEEEELG